MQWSKRKITKRQTIIHKTLHRKLKINNQESFGASAPLFLRNGELLGLSHIRKACLLRRPRYNDISHISK